MNTRFLASGDDPGQENPGQARGSPGPSLRWVGLLGIATIAVMRCVVAFAPQVVFDIDPAIDPTPLPGMGPAGSLFLDVLLLAACACGLLGEVLTKRGIDWVLVVLALVPAPVVLWHGVSDLGDLWRGSTWVAATVACVVIAHLSRDRSMRMVLIALLAAVLVPIAVRGAMQVRLELFGWSIVGPEYAEIVKEFEDNRYTYFEDRGWAPDSPAARIYERRLRQADPRGWFPTTNIFASMMALGLIVGVGLAIGAARGEGKRGKWWSAVMALGAAGALGGLLMSGSKGAALSAMAGLVLLLGPMLFRRARSLLTRLGGPVAIALVAATLLGVSVRGALLPEQFAGERSVLFRWHYLVGASRMMSQHPVVGVGPDGFQSAYVAVRLPRSPEEVTSAHNMGADWLATLGVGGAAWIGLVLVLVWRAGRRSGRDEIDEHWSSSPNPRAPLLAAAAVAVLALLPAIAQEALSIDSPAKELARGVGVLGYVIAAAGLAVALGRIPRTVVDWTLTAAVVALAVHAQIEMTFFDPGSVVWMMCIVGLAGGAVSRRRAVSMGVGASGLLVIGVLWIVAAGAIPAKREQTKMIAAAEAIQAAGGDRSEQARQRELAADLLTSAYEQYTPTDVRTLEEAARQLLIAASLTAGPRRMGLIDAAIALAERAVADHGKPGSIALAGEAHRFKAAHTNARDEWDAAIRYARRMTEIDPHGIGVWRRLGDVLWDSGDREGAADAYRQALVNDANFALDALKQLPEEDRQRLRQRIAEISE